jgi:hypothetical protein
MNDEYLNTDEKESQSSFYSLNASMVSHSNSHKKLSVYQTVFSNQRPQASPLPEPNFSGNKNFGIMPSN